MATKIIMPQGGQDLTEGKILRWLRAEGEAVRKGEVVCEVETEKAAFDVEAPEDGVLLKILAPEGEHVPILSTIGVIGRPGEQIVPEQPARTPESSAPQAGLDLAGIRRRLGKEVEPEAGARASGRARRLAEERGIDLAGVRGTGPGGRITEKDVLALAEGGSAAAARPAPAPAQAPVKGNAVPLSKLRSVVAKRMQESKQTIPHFYVTVTSDVTDALQLREELNRRPDDGKRAKISVNDMVVRAAALALAELRQVNCTLLGSHVVTLDDVNIGIAVSLEQGLMVPVLPRADKLSLDEIAVETREIIGAVKAGKQPNLETGTFTITNLGMLGVESFAAIINPPETAILAVGSVEKRVTPGDGDAFRVRDLMKMTLSVDHRALDGVMAARFVNAVKRRLEDPRMLLPSGS